MELENSKVRKNSKKISVTQVTRVDLFFVISFLDFEVMTSVNCKSKVQKFPKTVIVVGRTSNCNCTCAVRTNTQDKMQAEVEGP